MQPINSQNLELAKKLIKSAKEKPIIIEAQTPEFNRKIVEYGKFDILLSPEKKASKKGLRNLDSGLDHVTAKAAAKNNVSIGIDLNYIRQLNKKEKAITLAAIKQNIRICRKAKAKLAGLNFRDKKDYLAFMLTLKASTKQASESV